MNHTVTEFAMFRPKFMFDEEYAAQASEALERQKYNQIESLGSLIQKCLNKLTSKKRIVINVEDKIVQHDANDMAIDQFHVDLDQSVESVPEDYKKLFERISEVEYDLGGAFEAQKDQKEPATTEYLIPLLRHIT